MTMIDRLGWALVHSMWEGVAVAAVLGVVLWMLRGGPARVRYSVSCLGMLVLVGLPVATFFWIDDGDDTRVIVGAAGERAPQAERLNEARGGGVVFVGNLVSERSHDPSVGTSGPWSPLPLVVVAWGVGVVIMGIWQAAGVLWLGILLRRRTSDAGPEMLAALARMRERVGVRRRVGIRRASWVDVPAVVGVLRPVVLVPVAVMNGLSPQQVEALIAHELAHVRRWDALVNWGVNLVQMVMFYHPAAWYLSRRIREEREHCCDDAAAEACGDRLGYAKALVAMEEGRGVRGGVGVLVMAANGVGGRRQLLSRIRRVLGYSAEERGRSGGGATRSLAAVMVALVCVAVPLAAVRSSWAQEQKRGEAGAGEAGFKKAAEPDASDPTGEDLEVEATVYQVQPGDALQVTLHELAGQGKETTKTMRVSAKGTISLPLVGEIVVAGLGEAGIEKTVSKKYNEAGLVQHMMVLASVVEARGNMFTVIGGASRPGQYAIAQPDFRVLDAMAVAGVEAKGGEMYVLRAPASKGAEGKEKARKIRISLEKLLAGDLKQNIVIRRGDTVIVPAKGQMRGGVVQDELEKVRRQLDQVASEREELNVRLHEALAQIARLNEQVARGGANAAKVLRLALSDKGALSMDGQAATWEKVEETIKQIPQGERGRVVLELSASDNLTIRQYAEATAAAEGLVKKYGLAKLQLTRGDVPRGGARGQAADHAGGEYYLIGGVPRAGQYTMLPGTFVTLKQALEAAGQDLMAERLVVQLMRRDVNGREAYVIQGELLAKLMSDEQWANLHLKAGDMIHVYDPAMRAKRN